MAKDNALLHPRENPHLFGYAEEVAHFQAEFARGVPHHAYLIAGPKGIGKATLAYHLARHILGHGALAAREVPQEASFSLFGDPAPAPVDAAEKGPEDEALFRRIAAGSHTDLLTIQPAFDAKKQTEKSSISIEESRKIPDFLSRTAAEGDWRVVIVDAVDQLTTAAANALLKILEEPPANAILLLVCHQVGGILPTIRSRCRLLKLNPPSEAAFNATLETVAPSISRVDYDPYRALAEGSAGLAIQLHSVDALKWYAQWLAALQPNADTATRTRLADMGGNQKTPEGWQMFLYCFRVILERLTLWPHAGGLSPVLPQEGEQLAAIAQATPTALRMEWATRAHALLNVTDTFNLDKRQTIHMLLNPTQLDRMAI